MTDRKSPVNTTALESLADYLHQQGQHYLNSMISQDPIVRRHTDKLAEWEKAVRDVIGLAQQPAPASPINADAIALDAAYKIECLPSDLRPVQKTARIQLVVLDAMRVTAQSTPDHHPSKWSEADTSAVARWMMGHGYATGHGDTLDDMLGELVYQVHANALLEFHKDSSATSTPSEPAQRTLRETDLIAELRKLAIRQHQRPAYGGAFVNNGRSCAICKGGWSDDAPELHTVTCPLAAVSSTPSEPAKTTATEAQKVHLHFLKNGE